MGTRDYVGKPLLVESLVHERVVSGAAGAYHSLVVTKTGDLYSFGAHYKKDTTSAVYFGTGNLSAHKRAMIEESYLSYLRASADRESRAIPSSSNDSDQSEESSPGSGGAFQLHCSGTNSAFKRFIQDRPQLVCFPSQGVRVLSVRAELQRYLFVCGLHAVYMLVPCQLGCGLEVVYCRDGLDLLVALSSRLRRCQPDTRSRRPSRRVGDSSRGATTTRVSLALATGSPGRARPR